MKKEILFITSASSQDTKLYNVSRIIYTSSDSVLSGLRRPYECKKLNRACFEAETAFYDLLSKSNINTTALEVIVNRESRNNIEVYLDRPTIIHGLGEKHVLEYSLVDLKKDLYERESNAKKVTKVFTASKHFLVIRKAHPSEGKNFVIEFLDKDQIDYVIRVVKNPEQILKINRQCYKANASFHNMIDLSTFDNKVEKVINDKQLLDNIDVYVDDFTIRHAFGKNNVLDYSLLCLQRDIELKKSKEMVDKIKNSSSLTDLINKTFNVEKRYFCITNQDGEVVYNDFSKGIEGVTIKKHYIPNNASGKDPMLTLGGDFNPYLGHDSLSSFKHPTMDKVKIDTGKDKLIEYIHYDNDNKMSEVRYGVDVQIDYDKYLYDENNNLTHIENYRNGKKIGTAKLTTLPIKPETKVVEDILESTNIWLVSKKCLKVNNSVIKDIELSYYKTFKDKYFYLIPKDRYQPVVVGIKSEHNNFYNTILRALPEYILISSKASGDKKYGIDRVEDFDLIDGNKINDIFRNKLEKE